MIKLTPLLMNFFFVAIVCWPATRALPNTLLTGYPSLKRPCYIAVLSLPSRLSSFLFYSPFFSLLSFRPFFVGSIGTFAGSRGSSSVCGLCSSSWDTRSFVQGCRSNLGTCAFSRFARPFVWLCDSRRAVILICKSEVTQICACLPLLQEVDWLSRWWQTSELSEVTRFPEISLQLAVRKRERGKQKCQFMAASSFLIGERNFAAWI